MDQMCGFYYNIPQEPLFGGVSGIVFEKRRLALLGVKAHTTILATTSKTVLSQTFTNDSKGPLDQITYTFPLYDRVSIVSCTCTVNDRVIKGAVENRDDARKTYTEATARGETAGLLEQSLDASDIFTTTVGNIPADSKITVVIEFIGELKHDAETDGIRFTIPARIAPRYTSQGSFGSPFQPRRETNTIFTDARDLKGIEIVVDVEMPGGCPIKQIQSASHPLAVSMGTISTAPNDEFQTNKASATLGLAESLLDTDFVLVIVAKEVGVPRAILEIHPAISGQRAIMATLVPKFKTTPQLSEMIFICDRSGSMGGNSIMAAKSALKVFLKSLPIGSKFNICSFGSRHTFLWPRSKTYDQSTLDEAYHHIETFGANYGGTETFAAVKATLDSRFKDLPLEVMLITDGQISGQQSLFSYLNKEVGDSKAPIRVFTLGIGSSVSSGLIEGVARAGNGFSQFVNWGEKLEKKVIRMLKGALSPHVKDFRLELQYEDDESMVEDDFEMVEGPQKPQTNRTLVGRSEGPPSVNTRQEKSSVSLFDEEADADDESTNIIKLGHDQLGPFPSVTPPKILQSPFDIPPLFAFNTTTVYLLLSPEDADRPIKSLTLCGTCVNGDELKLEIPVQTLDTPGDTIHKLAVKDITAELEEGRGWTYHAKDEDGHLLKDKYESQFQDMVKHEAVRLGVKYQISGRWCSWVAVEDSEKILPNAASAASTPVTWDTTDCVKATSAVPERNAPGSSTSFGGPGFFGSAVPQSQVFALAAPPPAPSRFGGLFSAAGGLFGSSSTQKATGSVFGCSSSSTTNVTGTLFGSSSIPNSSSLFGAPAPAAQHQSFDALRAGSQLFGNTHPGRTDALPRSSTSGTTPRKQLASKVHKKSIQVDNDVVHCCYAAPVIPNRVDEANDDEDTRFSLELLIDLQSFDGHWNASNELQALIKSHGVLEDQVIAAMKWESSKQYHNIAATALVLANMELELGEEEEAWELVAEKAREWIRSVIGVDEAEVLREKVMGLMA